MHEVIPITRANRPGPLVRVSIDIPLFDIWWPWRVVIRAWLCR